MATIEGYGSGRVLWDIRYAHIALGFAGAPIIGPVIAQKLELRMEPSGINPITLAEAGSVIERCGHCAAGPRICQPLFPRSQYFSNFCDS
ncbi:MAG: hypothetical protein WC362_01805 [Methanoregula sp.]|jgi:hypothetical protein